MHVASIRRFEERRRLRGVGKRCGKGGGEEREKAEEEVAVVVSKAAAKEARQGRRRWALSKREARRGRRRKAGKERREGSKGYGKGPRAEGRALSAGERGWK